MAWTVLTVILLVLTIIFLRKRLLSRFWTGGLWATLLYFTLLHIALELNLYSFQGYFYTFNNIPLFLLTSVFLFGILFVRFLPDQKGMQIIYMAFISVVLVILESFFKEMDFIAYNNWQNLFSLPVNIIFLITLSWLSDLTVPKRRGYFFH